MDTPIVDTKTGKKWPNRAAYLRDHPIPWWKPAYWWVRRKWDWLTDQPYEWQRFWQRGRRGWGDRDVWSIDGYLAEIIPGMVRRLKATHKGIPTDCFDLDPTNENGGIKDDEEGWRIAEARWHAILDDIAFTFDVVRHVQDHDWDIPRDGEWTAEWYARMTELWKGFPHPIHVMTAEEAAQYERGWAAFRKHFYSLWY